MPRRRGKQTAALDARYQQQQQVVREMQERRSARSSAHKRASAFGRSPMHERRGESPGSTPRPEATAGRRPSTLDPEAWPITGALCPSRRQLAPAALRDEYSVIAAPMKKRRHRGDIDGGESTARELAHIGAFGFPLFPTCMYVPVSIFWKMGSASIAKFVVAVEHALAIREPMVRRRGNIERTHDADV